MKIILVLASLTIAASGCVAERPAQGDTLAKIQLTCQGYGFQPGTPNFAACVMQLDQNRISENINRRRAFGAALQNMGNQMQANAQNQAMINAMNRPRTCRTTGYGTTLTTVCN